METQYLSQREREILRLISFGKSVKEISTLLFISEHTIVTHKKNISLKLGSRNMAGMVRRGFEVGILNLSA